MNNEPINTDRDWVAYWQAREEYALMRAEIASKALSVAPRVGQLVMELEDGQQA